MRILAARRVAARAARRARARRHPADRPGERRGDDARRRRRAADRRVGGRRARRRGELRHRTADADRAGRVEAARAGVRPGEDDRAGRSDGPPDQTVRAARAGRPRRRDLLAGLLLLRRPDDRLVGRRRAAGADHQRPVARAGLGDRRGRRRVPGRRRPAGHAGVLARRGRDRVRERPRRRADRRGDGEGHAARARERGRLERERPGRADPRRVDRGARRARRPRRPRPLLPRAVEPRRPDDRVRAASRTRPGARIRSSASPSPRPAASRACWSNRPRGRSALRLGAGRAARRRPWAELRQCHEPAREAAPVAEAGREPVLRAAARREHGDPARAAAGRPVAEGRRRARRRARPDAARHGAGPAPLRRGERPTRREAIGAELDRWLHAAGFAPADRDDDFLC